MQYGNFKGEKDKKINVMKILLLFHIVNYYSLVTNKFYIKPFFLRFVYTKPVSSG